MYQAFTPTTAPGKLPGSSFLGVVGVIAMFRQLPICFAGYSVVLKVIQGSKRQN